MYYRAGQEKIVPQQALCLVNGSLFNSFADFGGANRYIFHFVLADFLHFIARGLTMPLEVVDVPLPVETEPVIIPYDNIAWMKLSDQKFLDVLIGTLLRELYSKGHHYNVVDVITTHKIYLLVNGGDELQAVVSGVNDQPGVGVESNHDAFSVALTSEAFDPVQDLLMPQVHTIEGTDSHHSILKIR